MKNKKPLIALLLVAILGTVGVTFAYFTSEDTFKNIFNTKPYIMEVTDTFESPTNWTPGTTTEKKIIATNKGDVDAAVRISYEESWTDASGNTLALKDEEDRSAAIINFSDTLKDNWTISIENGKEYYYYNTIVKKGESTETLIESITFNKDVTISSEDNCVTEGNKTICTTTTSGYAGGTYTLTIKVETVQSDQYKEAWNTAVNIKK